MKRIYITKVLPDGYGVGVIPEMEKPSTNKDEYDNNPHLFMDAWEKWDDHLASLPTFLLHPSLHPKEGEWIEQDGYYLQIQDLVDGEWIDRIDGDYVNFNGDKTTRRIVAMKINTICGCGQCTEEYQHASDCAVHNEPAMPNGKCDCKPVLLPLVEKKPIEPEIEIYNLWFEKESDHTQANILTAIKHAISYGKTFPYTSTPPEGNTPASEQGDETFIDILNDIVDVLEGKKDGEIGLVDKLWFSGRLVQLKSLIPITMIKPNPTKEDMSIFFDSIKNISEVDRKSVDEYFSEYYISEIDKIEGVFPKDFHPNTTLAGRVMNLWQYYEAEVNKNKSLTESLSRQSPASLQEREKEWVNINDRLPDEMQSILVYGRKPSEIWAIQTTVYMGRNFFSGMKKVSHWQPLPSPPNESQDTAKQSK